MVARYALYFAPALGSALAKFGAAVLDPGAAWADQTTSARHYGFHATLKAPFELGEDAEVAALEAALTEFAATHRSVNLPGLAPRPIGGHTALTCGQQSQGLIDLHSALVRDFDAFRRPLSDADYQRRNPKRLSERQRDNLLAYGYPFIFQDFEFHMTLGRGKLDMADHLYAELVGDRPQVCDTLAIFMQPNREGGFRPIFSRPLTG